MALCQHQSLSTQLWWNKCPLGILFNWDTPPRRQITTFPFYRWRSFFSKLSNLLKVTLLYWFKDRVQIRTLVCPVPTPCTCNSFAFNPEGIKGSETEDSVYKTHLGWVFIKSRGFFFGGAGFLLYFQTITGKPHFQIIRRVWQWCNIAVDIRRRKINLIVPLGLEKWIFVEFDTNESIFPEDWEPGLVIFF